MSSAEDLLRKELFGLKSIELEIYPLKFGPKHKANITVNGEIDHPE